VTKLPASFLTRSHIFAAVFFAIFIFLLYQMARLLAPFSSALLWAAILALALSPVHTRLLRLVSGREGLAAGVMTFSTLLMVIGPAIFLLAVLTAQAVNLYQWTSEFIQTGRLAEAWSRIATPMLDRLLNLPFLAEIDVKGILIKGLSQFSSGLASQIGNVLKNTLLLVVNLFIMLIFLFFILRDGESYYSAVMDVLPFTPDQQQSITRKFRDTFSAVINGVFLVAFLQGVMTGLGFALFGVPFSVFWGFLAAVLALLPVGGAMLVWVPGALYLYLTGSTLQGVFLAIWGTLLVSLPDNFLKPLLIGRKAKLPTFLLLIGILGGLQVYGFLGILFGPLVVTLLTAFVQIYREEYAERHE
jgi:predicted PurR-regulated permease PerM